MLINPELVLEALSVDRAIREYQLIVRKADPADPDSMDSLVVRLEVDAQARARLAAEIPAIVQQIFWTRPGRHGRMSLRYCEQPAMFRNAATVPKAKSL